MSSLQQKIADVLRRFQDLCSRNTTPPLPLRAPAPVAVAWTGGKDSTVVLHLWKTFLEEHGLRERFPLAAVNIDTGLKFPEVVAFRDRLACQWGLELHVAAPDVSLQEYPVAEDVTDCCKKLKIAPLQRCLRDQGFEALLTGLRGDEHPSRKERSWLEPRQNPQHLQCNPILEWQEMDVWAYIMDQGLPYCELYTQGYRSLGCTPCTTHPAESAGAAERAGRNQEKEAQLEQLRSLGYF